jgi:hypothetical protein
MIFSNVAMKANADLENHAFSTSFSPASISSIVGIEDL